MGTGEQNFQWRNLGGGQLKRKMREVGDEGVNPKTRIDNMAASNVNGRLHLTGVHQKPPASLGQRANVFPHPTPKHLTILNHMVRPNWYLVLYTKI